MTLDVLGAGCAQRNAQLLVGYPWRGMADLGESALLTRCGVGRITK